MKSKRSPQRLSKLKKKDANERENFIKIDDKIEMIPNESGMFEIGAGDISNLTSIVPTPTLHEVNKTIDSSMKKSSRSRSNLKSPHVKSPYNPNKSIESKNKQSLTIHNYQNS